MKAQPKTKGKAAPSQDGLTKAQRIMVDDGLPSALLISLKERADWWDKNPPKPFRWIDNDDPEVIARKRMESTLKEQQVLVRNNRFANLKAKKDREALDITGMRWDSIKARFIPDTNSQEYINMPKWTITPYDANDAPIQKGITLIAEGSGEVVVYAKMGAVFHRCAEGTVKKVVVTNGGGEIIRQWDQSSSAPLPKPEAPSVNGITVEGKGKKGKADQTIKKAKAKGEKRAAKGAKLKSDKKPGVPRGEGVIATVTKVLVDSGKKGTTVDLILAALVKAFPDRDPESMVKTIRVQMSRQEATKEKQGDKVLYFAKGVK